MLRRIPICCALAAWFCLAAAGISRAEVEWSKRYTLQTENPPVAMAVSADGNYTFVLTEAGKVLVYSAGTLEGSIDAGKDVRGISVSADGSTLFLADAKGSAIQILSIDFIQKINIASAPFKGPADAPVTVVVFSDFQ